MIDCCFGFSPTHSCLQRNGFFTLDIMKIIREFYIDIRVAYCYRSADREGFVFLVDLRGNNYRARLSFVVVLASDMTYKGSVEMNAKHKLGFYMLAQKL